YQTEFGFVLSGRNIVVDDIRVRGVGKSLAHSTVNIAEADSSLPVDRYQATMTGRAVQILQTQNNNVTQFDNEALEAVFLREDVRDKRVVVVSISGIFGKGKSFLLNYMLKYLNSQVNLSDCPGCKARP
ncbi:unnamed protein product, partial [Timema podura]|nr:unnamed protein product [Timema podura]